MNHESFMDIILTILTIFLSFLIVCLFAIWRISKEVVEIEDGEQLDILEDDEK